MFKKLSEQIKIERIKESAKEISKRGSGNNLTEAERELIFTNKNYLSEEVINFTIEN